MTPRTRAELILAARQRADMETSLFVGASEAVDMLMQSWHELYDLLIEAYGEAYFEITNSVSVAANATGFDLTSLVTNTESFQFYKLSAVRLVIGDGEFQLDREERRATRTVTARSWDWYFRPTYRIEGMFLRWLPPPASAVTVLVSWVPMPQELTSDLDLLPQQAQPWEEYLIVDWAIKAMQKEESDVSMLMARKDQITERIRKMAPRDIGTPAIISRVDGANGSLRGGGWGS